MEKQVLDPDKVLVIHDFLSREECTALIRRSEDLAYEAGTVADVVIEQVRNNERVLVDDLSLAADLFHRAELLLPAVIDGHGLAGFNERWRFYRYGPGQTFKPHRDGSYVWMERWEESHMTFMIYLNEGMTGGETRFFGGHGAGIPTTAPIPVRPAKGRDGTRLFTFHLARGCRSAQRAKVCAAHRCDV